MISSFNVIFDDNLFELKSSYLKNISRRFVEAERTYNGEDAR